jgi:putative hydrolase of the HAD superfamily
LTPVRLVLFDLDDTLFDHLYASECATAAIHRSHPVLSRRPVELLHREHYRLLNEIHPRMLRGEMTLAEARSERWRRLFEWAGVSVDTERSNEIADQYRRIYGASQRCVPGAVALLEALKPRVRVGIVTNNLTEEQEGKLRVLKLEGRIDFMVTSEDAGIAKPHPAIFEAALKRAERKPEESVMIGDSWASDVLGARAAGIRAIWINREGAPRPDPSPDVTEIRSYEPPDAVWRAIFEPER